MGVGEVAEADRLRTDPGHASHKARVLKLHVWAPAFTGFGGGITAFSRALATALRDLGHDVRLFGKADRASTFERLPLVGARRYSGLSQSRIFALRAVASAGRRRPDHIVSTHVNFGPAAHIAKRAFGTPYTLVAHGIDIHPGLPPATLAAMRSADGIVAVSEWTRLRVLDLGGIDPQAVTILPNTFDEERFTVAPPRQDLRERYGLRDGEKVILTVARLAPHERYKGYDRLIHALPSIREACGSVRFMLVGYGADKERVQALAAVLGIRRMVTLTGFVSDAELADHYRMADVFAMPSTGEGFGIVFLESMACGTPVLAGNRDGSVDALARGRLGCLVDPNDLGAISSGICAILGGEGPPLWFDRPRLREEAVRIFGEDSFRRRVNVALRFLS
jgi:glycosyltransferase involved in cell wall biosynthesis